MMTKIRWFVLMLWGAAICLTAQLATSVAVGSDETAIRQALASYVESFNKQDLEAVAALWAPKGTHTDRETGDRTEGREAIRADIAVVFEERPTTRLTARLDRFRLIRPDVAQVEGQTTVSSADQSPVFSTFSGIMIKEDGRWLLDSIDEMPLPQPTTPYEALRELEWLVGRWVDDSDEARVETSIRWSPNRTFLIRSFVAESNQGLTQLGTQIIGWDPRSQEIRSWTFNSDGSFGDATWSKNGQDWLIKSSQTLADGQAASGTFVLSQTGNSAITLQLIGHEIEGEPQPTGKTIKVVRAAIADDSDSNTPPQGTNQAAPPPQTTTPGNSPEDRTPTNDNNQPKGDSR